jgi:PPOX class probable F420-dependent enzyme
MTSKTSQGQDEMNDPFAYLYSYEFVLLTTFRKNGLGVPTAMWFAHEHSKLYMVTGHTTGKIKRIRKNEHVLLAPCDLMGNILGPQIEAYARELPVPYHVHANALLASKYGAEYEMDSSSEEYEEYEEDKETFIEIESIPGNAI